MPIDRWTVICCLSDRNKRATTNRDKQNRKPHHASISDRRVRLDFTGLPRVVDGQQWVHQSGAVFDLVFFVEMRPRFVLFLSISSTALIFLPAIWRSPPKPPVIDISSLQQLRSVHSEKDIPEDLSTLDGKRVAVTGEAWFYSSTKPNRQFALVRIEGSTGLSGAPRPEDRVQVDLVSAVKLPDEETIDESVKVSGIFHVKIERDETGMITSVYHLDADQILPWTTHVPPPTTTWMANCRIAGTAGLIGLLAISLGTMISKSFIRSRNPPKVSCRTCGYDLRATSGRCPECGRSNLEPVSNCPDRNCMVPDTV